MKTVVAVLLVVALALAGPVVAQRPGSPMPGGVAGPGRGPMGGMAGMHSMLRHRYVMREGLPQDYRGLTNPLTPSAEVIAEGRRVYEQTCALCHGEKGEGDGLAGASLDPRPSNISVLPPMPVFSGDAYLYWTIAEGGAPVGSAMPPFREALSAGEIWSVILALRQGF